MKDPLPGPSVRVHSVLIPTLFPSCLICCANANDMAPLPRQDKRSNQKQTSMTSRIISEIICSNGLRFENIKKCRRKRSVMSYRFGCCCHDFQLNEWLTPPNPVTRYSHPVLTEKKIWIPPKTDALLSNTVFLTAVLHSKLNYTVFIIYLLEAWSDLNCDYRLIIFLSLKISV